jgi:hypothetical protein
MLHDKGTKIISELKNYFSSDEKLFQTLFSELHSLRNSDRHFCAIDKINTKYAGFQRLVILILFPLFEIRHISDYQQSHLYQIVACGKDVFYRFINNANFHWRKFAYAITNHLIKRVEHNSEIPTTRALNVLLPTIPICRKRANALNY